MRKTSQVSRLRAALTVMAVLVALALWAPLAQAQTDTVARGGELKCGNNLPAQFVKGASATLVWTGPVPANSQTFTCSTTTTTGLETQTVNQPLAATGWRLSISWDLISGPVADACTDSGSFTAGDMPHIRLRCVSPDGGAATFSLSRNP